MKAKTLQIHWHEKQPVYSCHFEPLEPFRLATCGADSCIRTWRIEPETENSSGTSSSVVTFLSTLSRHTGGVNVVRWHPKKHGILASGGDDGSIIIWKENQTGASSSGFGFGQDPSENSEGWAPSTVLLSPTRSAIFDMAWTKDGDYVLAGSDMDFAVRLYSVETKAPIQTLTQHISFVQGVAWDPLGKYCVSQSRDRTLRVYSVDFDAKKNTPLACVSKSFKLEDIKLASDANDENAKATQETQGDQPRPHLYHNESLLTFFRRPSFSPDGSLLVSPCGLFKNNAAAKEGNDNHSHVAFVYSRNCLKKSPIAFISGFNQAATVVSFSPMKYKLKDHHSDGSSQPNSWLSLPYRMIFAVATREEVLICDTQHMSVVAECKRFHYDNMSDLAWSPDGLNLLCSSIDGFCTLIKFEQGELGEVYEEVISTTVSTSKSTETLMQDAQATVLSTEVPANTVEPFLNFIHAIKALMRTSGIRCNTLFLIVAVSSIILIYPFFLIKDTPLYSTRITLSRSNKLDGIKTEPAKTDARDNTDTVDAALDCSIENAKLYPGTIRTALTSFPRSGNTFLRLLIEKSTGFLTSSIYCDRFLRNTFKSECNKTNMFLQKTHYPVNALLRYGEKAQVWRDYNRSIHIIRNPFDAIWSYHSYHKTQNHTLKLDILKSSSAAAAAAAKAPPIELIKEGKMRWYVDKYKRHYEFWRDAPIPTLFVKFEDLKQSDGVSEIELLRINEFLLKNTLFDDDKLNVNTDYDHLRKRVQCAVKDSKRAYESDTQKESVFYSLKKLSAPNIKVIIEELGQILCQNGYAVLLKKQLERSTLSLDSDKLVELEKLDCQSYEATWL